MAITNPARLLAMIEELQTQRSFLGDRALILSADLAEKTAELELFKAKVSELEEKLTKMDQAEENGDPQDVPHAQNEGG